MSSELYVCYGYYVVGKYRYVEDHKIKYECENFHAQVEQFSYCPQCGKPVNEVKVPIKVALDLDDIDCDDEDYALNERFFFMEYVPENTFMCISNEGAIQNIDTNADATEIDHDDRKNMLDDFLEEHEEDVEYLRTIFDDVEIKFGIITYYN